MAGKLLLLRAREYNKVQQSCMGWPNEYNIIQHRGKQKKCCIVQHLFSEKFDRDQTSYNKIQHDKTRYNKVAKRVQHFIKHRSRMMLYEMLYSFGRGFKQTQVTTEDGGCCPSNVGHVSRMPLHFIYVITPGAGHVVEVTFQNHCRAYDLYSNRYKNKNVR